MFRDREQAGEMLAERLEALRGTDAVVLALPRGGVVPGQKVAEALALPLDIIVVRKIGHPGNPEYAAGATDAEGRMLLDVPVLIDPAWLRVETQRQQKEAKRREQLYRGGREPIALKGKTAVIVDDGIATGATMRLAVHAARGKGAARVIIAVPVAPKDALEQLLAEGADETVVLEPPAVFAGAVGAHYESFPQVSDAEVEALLQGADA